MQKGDRNCPTLPYVFSASLVCDLLLNWERCYKSNTNQQMAAPAGLSKVSLTPMTMLTMTPPAH